MMAYVTRHGKTQAYVCTQNTPIHIMVNMVCISFTV